MLRDIQLELKDTKKELCGYQNRWQRQRKENDEHVEKLRSFELKTSNLSHEVHIHKRSVDSKAKEIERLNGELKAQQTALLKSHAEGADTKARLFALNNDVDKLRAHSEQIEAEQARLQTQFHAKIEECNAAKTAHKALQSALSEKTQALHCAEMALAEAKAKGSAEQHRAAELKAKYDALKEARRALQATLDEKEDALLDADEKIEEVHLESARERKELSARLERKLGELEEATRALCELQSELEAKTAALAESEALLKKHNALWAQLQSERDALQRSNAEMATAKESVRRELEGTQQRLAAAEAKLKGTVRSLQQTTLTNERLRDDLESAAQTQNGNGDIERKYAKLQTVVVERNELIETMKASLIRRKARNEKYERAVTAWKQHSEELESKVKEQNAEIMKLRPNEKKFR